MAQRKENTSSPTIGEQLQYTGSLPEVFAVLNPYFDNPETI